MSTRTSARHRGPDPRSSDPSGDLDRYSPAGDPQPAHPAEAPPPWAEYATDSGSTLLARDLNHGSAARTGDPDRGPAARNSDRHHGTARRGTVT